MSDTSFHLRRQSIAQRLFAPVDLASIAFFRICFGLIMAWEALRYLVPRADGTSWVERFYIEPMFLFKYDGFSWVHPWPGDGMIWHVWVMGLAGLLVALGAFYRAAAVLLFITITHLFLLDQAHYLNHLYLVCLISALMIVIPAHRVASLDAWMRRSAMPRTGPAWTLWLLRFQIGVVYFFGGIAKLNRDWLGGNPLRHWLAARSDGPVIGPWLTEPWAAHIFSYGGLFFDLLIVPLLLWRRTRAPAFAIAILFHLLNAWLFQIGIFPWFMIAATALFFGPSWPRRLLLSSTPAHSPPPTDRPQPSALALACLAVYVAAQLLIPLRHHLYTGDVNWTYEGHRFSWRMKLHDRHAIVQMWVIESVMEITTPVDLDQYLTRWQQRRMGARPDMLCQFARYVAEEYRAQGFRDVEVRAHVLLSLNRRPYRTFIDPSVNLLAGLRAIPQQ